MLLPSLFELFCSYNCDGPTAMVLRRGKNVSVHTTAMLLPSLFERFCDGPTATVFVKGNWLFCSARESLLAGLLAGRGMGMHASKGSSLACLSYGTGMKEMSQAGNGSGSHYYLVTEMIIDECGQGSKKKVP